MKLNILSKSVLVALSALGLTACGSDSDSTEATVDLGPAILTIGTENTNQVASVTGLPIPNDLYTYQEINTGTIRNPEMKILVQSKLQINDCSQANNDAGRCALTDLDGWSTTAPFTIPVLGDASDIDETTLASSVILFEADNQIDQTQAATLTPLIFDEDYTVRISSFGYIQVLPLKPFAEKTTYVLAITEELKTTSGQTILTNDGYDGLKNPIFDGVVDTTEERFAEAYQQHLANVETSLGFEPLYATSFTTMSIGDEFASLAGVPAVTMEMDYDGNKMLGTKNVGTFQLGSITNLGVIGDGDAVCDAVTEDCILKASASNSQTVEVLLPNYFSEQIAPNGANCAADFQSYNDANEWFKLNGANSHVESYLYTAETCSAMFSQWDLANPSPSIDTVQINVVLPENYDGSTTLPVVIFIHGITAAKEFGNGGMTALDNFIQEYIANEGYAVLAIDHYMHGSRGYDFNGDGQYELSASQSVRGLFPGNEAADVKNFLKADALLTSRDNFRQSVADVLNLVKSLDDQNNFDGISLDTANIKLVGHSMGAIVAATATGILNELTPGTIDGTVLANPGAGISGVLFNSTWLGKDEVPPAVKMTEDFQQQVADRAGVKLSKLLDWIKSNKPQYDAIVADIEPAFMSEYQYLIQSVVDTVDPLNYVDTLSRGDVLSITVDGSIQSGVKPSENYGVVTTGDQTVPVVVELDKHTMFERCKGFDTAEYGAQGRCALGTYDQAYYELNNTEFPLSGAYPLEELIGLTNVRDGGNKVYTRTSVGTHNMGVGTLTETTAGAGNADSNLVGLAAKEVAMQTASFITNGTVDNSAINMKIVKAD